jgi:hypothetical protein
MWTKNCRTAGAPVSVLRSTRLSRIIHSITKHRVTGVMAYASWVARLRRAAPVRFGGNKDGKFEANWPERLFDFAVRRQTRVLVTLSEPGTER